MKKNLNQRILIILPVLLLLVATSYAWWSLTIKGTKTSVIKAGVLSLVLDDEASTGISLEDAVPVRDSVGLSSEAYTFKLKNTGDITSSYSIYLDDMELSEGESRMSDGFIKYSLTKNGGDATTQLLSAIGENPNRLLDNGTINKDTTYVYTLRLWINSDADNKVMGTTFRGNLRVEASQIK